MITRKLGDGGVLVITPERFFRDTRGFFLEAYRDSELKKVIGPAPIVQCNISRSVPFTLRGLHYQLGRPAQGKLLRCLFGKIFQVTVDVRRDSKTFGQYTGVILDDIRNESVWVPPGFANGFFAFEDGATVQYHMTAMHEPLLERSLQWNDYKVGIKWPMGPGGGMVMSPKDKSAPTIDEIERWA